MKKFTRTSNFRGYYDLLLESLESPHPKPTLIPIPKSASSTLTPIAKSTSSTLTPIPKPTSSTLTPIPKSLSSTPFPVNLMIEPKLPLPSSQSLSAKSRPFVFHPEFHSKSIPPSLDLMKRIPKKVDSSLSSPLPPSLPENCCMSNCIHCVWDFYYEELKNYRIQRRNWLLKMGGVTECNVEKVMKEESIHKSPSLDAFEKLELRLRAQSSGD